MLACTSIIVLSSGSRASMRSSPSSTANGSSPTCCLARSTAWPEALRVALADVVDVGQVARGSGRCRAWSASPLASSVCFELGDAVEVVLEGALVAAGDHQDVVDAGGDGLLDDVLDGRLVDDRQHLLGHRLGGGKETGAEAGCGMTALRTEALGVITRLI